MRWCIKSRSRPREIQEEGDKEEGGIKKQEEGDSERSDDDGQPDGKKSSLKKDGLEKKTFDKLEKSPEVKK
jgi:hypothetical protein